MNHRISGVLGMTVLFGLAACAGSDASSDSTPDAGVPGAEAAADVPAPQYVLDVRTAVDAVEADLGGPQQFFEVTSNEQFTNVFVAVDDATAAIAYAFVNGELQPPAPRQDGASGETFTSADIDFAEDRILSGVTASLSGSSIDAISLYGNGFGVTYVLAASSASGGFLDIEVGADGTVFSVDPI